MPCEQIDALIPETQASLGSLISRPRLTEPLLTRPPFRFLHDIVSEVTKVTGFAEGLYDETESNSANIKVRGSCACAWRTPLTPHHVRAQDKESKVAYLQKIIDCVSFALGLKIQIRPSKVVAGLEPESTNIFLQHLAAAARDPNVDGPAAVARVLAGETTMARAAAPPPQPAPQPEAPPSHSAAREEQPRPPPPPPPAGPQSAQAQPAGRDDVSMPTPATTDALNTFQSEAVNDEGVSGLAPRAERPRTARRAPPRVTSNTVRVDSVARPDEATRQNIIREGAGALGDEDEDEETVIVVDEAGAPLKADVQLNDSDGAGHGKIVQDIIKAQKEMDAAHEGDGDGDVTPGATEETPPADKGIILGRNRGGGKDKARSKDDVEKLRHEIQALCQACNPLGKSLQYVHEDLEAMNRELQQWRSQYAKHQRRMEEEGSQTDSSMQQLHASLQEADSFITEEKEKIRALKSHIIRNEATIDKLLQGVVS